MSNTIQQLILKVVSGNLQVNYREKESFLWGMRFRFTEYYTKQIDNTYFLVFCITLLALFVYIGIDSNM